LQWALIFYSKDYAEDLWQVGTATFVAPLGALKVRLRRAEAWQNPWKSKRLGWPSRRAGDAPPSSGPRPCGRAERRIGSRALVRTTAGGALELDDQRVVGDVQDDARRAPQHLHGRRTLQGVVDRYARGTWQVDGDGGDRRSDRGVVLLVPDVGLRPDDDVLGP